MSQTPSFNARENRGATINVGLVDPHVIELDFPEDIPVTDTQIVATDAMIARVEIIREELHNALQYAIGVRKALEGDVRKCMRLREDEAAGKERGEPQLPFEDAEEEGEDDVAEVEDTGLNDDEAEDAEPVAAEAGDDAAS